MSFTENDRKMLQDLSDSIAGKGDKSLRVFVRDQDIATRKIIADEHNATRLGTLAAILQQTSTLSAAIESLYQRIKKLAG